MTQDNSNGGTPTTTVPNKTKISGTVDAVGTLENVAWKKTRFGTSALGLDAAQLAAVELTVRVRVGADETMKLVVKGSDAFKFYCILLIGDDLNAIGTFEGEGDERLFRASKVNYTLKTEVK